MTDSWCCKVAGYLEDYPEGQPVAVLPFRSATEAREFCKAWSLPSKKVEEIANIIFDKAPYPHRCIRGKEHYRDIARTILRALHFNPGEKA